MLNNTAVFYLLAIYVFILLLCCVSLTPSKDKTEETIDIVPGDKWFKYEDVDLSEPGPTIVTIVSITEDGNVRFKTNTQPVSSLPVEVFLTNFRRIN